MYVRTSPLIYCQRRSPERGGHGPDGRAMRGECFYLERRASLRTEHALLLSTAVRHRRARRVPDGISLRQKSLIWVMCWGPLSATLAGN
jgi:hypothetical protein